MLDATPDSVLIKLSNHEYPIYFDDLKRRHPNIGFGAIISAAFLESLGYAVVERTSMPSNDVVYEGAPELIGDQWTQTWVSRPFNQAELDQLLEQAKVNIGYNAQTILVDAANKGIKFQFADKAMQMRLNVSDVAYLATAAAAAVDQYIVGSEYKITLATATEIADAAIAVAEGRQRLLTAYAEVLDDAEALTDHRNEPDYFTIHTKLFATLTAV